MFLNSGVVIMFKEFSEYWEFSFFFLGLLIIKVTGFFREFVF